MVTSGQVTTWPRQLIFGLTAITAETRDFANLGTALVIGSATRMDYTTQQGGSHTG